jgi:hypothetical protein
LVKIKSLTILLLVLIVGTCSVLYFFPSEEKKIKKQFALLSQWASKDQEENIFALVERGKRIVTLFDENCGLKIPPYSIDGRYTREEIAAYAAHPRSKFSRLNLEFYDLNISFPEESLARVSLTGKLTGESPGKENVNEIRELECVLKKIEGKWLFSEFEIVEVLKK